MQGPHPSPLPSATARQGRPGLRWNKLALLLIGAGLAAAAPQLHAQSLLELYQAARAFDATYLAARAQADSAPYRSAQAAALNRPSAALNGSLTTSQIDPPRLSRLGSTSANVGLSGRQSLYNRSNAVTISQAEKQLELSRHDLETAEQDLIVRVSQAYFDVLGAQDTLATTKACPNSCTMANGMGWAGTRIPTVRLLFLNSFGISLLAVTMKVYGPGSARFMMRNAAVSTAFA